MGVGDDIYTGASEYGKIMALIGAVIGTFMSIVLIIFGIIFILSKPLYTGEVDGTITNEPQCIPVTTTSNNTTTTRFNCNGIDVDYKVEGKDYKSEGLFHTNDFALKKGNKLKLFYKPENPADVITDSDNKHVLGGIMIGSAVFILVGVWAWFFITKYSKFASAAGGAASAYNLFKK
jgi:hypothetical protein